MLVWKKKVVFYSGLDGEIQAAIDSEHYICVQLDGNGKFGSSIIKGDPHQMSNNGKLLLDLITRKNLILVNSTEKCEGTITRSKVVGGKTEQSVIDFFFVCQNLFQLKMNQNQTFICILMKIGLNRSEGFP